jgi:hypothetical protein
MQAEVARLCEQLGISQTENSDGGAELTVRDSPCQTLQGAVADTATTAHTKLSRQPSEAPVAD